VLKASRLARLTRDGKAQELLGYEIGGYPHNGSDADLLAQIGRWADKEKGTAYVKPLSHLSSLAAAERAKLAMMQKSNFSGDMV
jgi:hypothetical protein